MKRRLILFVMILSLFFLVFTTFFLIKRDKESLEKKEVKEETTKYIIYLPSSEIKEINLKRESFELRRVEEVIESFISELPNPFRETQILGVYRDKENVIYVSLSSSFASSQSAKEEYLLLKSFYLTLKENFTWIKDVKILIDDKEVETLSGHIIVYKSLSSSLEDK
ncbi:MAG: GerMN domain-containing protein [Thermodesulfovibrio sp.]|nr:GerMN domain-containing protein [Thermodesulfovibrio sp.]